MICLTPSLAFPIAPCFNSKAGTLLNQPVGKTSDAWGLVQGQAGQQREQLRQLVEATDKQVAALAAWFGEPVDNDPAGVLVALWAFIQSFDQAFRRVQLLQLA